MYLKGELPYFLVPKEGKKPQTSQLPGTNQTAHLQNAAVTNMGPKQPTHHCSICMPEVA